MKDIQGLRQVPSTEKAEPRPQILQPLSTLGILESRLIELGIHVDGPSAADHLIAIVLAGCDHLGIAGTCCPSAVPQWGCRTVASVFFSTRSP